MEKIVYKIVGFMVVLGIIISVLEDCKGSIVDRMLDVFLNPLTSCDRQKYIDELDKEKPKNAAEFIGVCITQIGICNNDITNISSTNINIQEEFKSVNKLVNNYNQIISNHNNIIKNTTINQNNLTNWVDEHNTYVNILNNKYDDVRAKIDALTKEQKELKDKIESLKDYVSKYDKILSEDYYKEKTKIENYISELNIKLSSLTTEINTSKKMLKELKESIDKCTHEIEKINKKLDELSSGDVPVVDSVDGTGKGSDGDEIENKTFYIIIGSEDELKEKGIVISGGLFGGLKVTSNPNKDLFAFLSGKDKSILLGSEKSDFDVISDIPADSYDIRIINKTKILVIKDINSFWSKTEYLVITESE